MSEKITEKESLYKHLETMNVIDILTAINDQDKSVPIAIEKSLHRIETVVILSTAKIRWRYDKVVDQGARFALGVAQ